jgi:hypothetical protein
VSSGAVALDRWKEQESGIYGFLINGLTYPMQISTSTVHRTVNISWPDEDNVV